MDRCEEIKKQIKELQDELKELQSPRHIDYSQYRLFRNGIYSPSLAECLRDDLRHLAVRLVSLKEVTRNFGGSLYGTKYLTCEPRYKIPTMTREEIKFCNDFISEICPIVKKYAELKLSENKEEK